MPISRLSLVALVLSIGPMSGAVAKHKDAPISLACSSVQTSANINELNDNNSGLFFDFIEIKILLDGTDISGWTLCVADNGSQNACTTLGLGKGYWSDSDNPLGDPPANLDNDSQAGNTVFSADTWIIYREDSADGAPSDKLRADSGSGEVILRDALGNVIDYIAYDAAGKSCSGSRAGWDQDRWDVPVAPAVGACGVCFDGKNSSNKNLARAAPDGTGGWADTNADPTEGSSNDTGTGGSTADHYAIGHDGTGVTCAAEAITIFAHSTDGPPVQEVDPGNITISLSTSTGEGQWSSVLAGTGVLSGNAGFDGLAVYEFPGNGETSVTLAFNYPSVTADPELVNINVTDGSATDLRDNTNAEDADLSVSLTGFLFNTIPTQIASKDSDQGWNAQLLQVQAVKAQDSDPSVCTALFGGSVTIELGAECESPSSCAAGVSAGPDDSNLATAANPAVAIASNADNGGSLTSAYSDVSLDFDADARAYFALNYPEAGRLQLHARYELQDENGLPSGEYLTGSSNLFVVRPFALGFTNIDDNGSPAQVNPGGVAPAGNAFIAAGSTFWFDIGGYRYADGEDPNDNGIADDGFDVTDNGLTTAFAAPATLALDAITPVGSGNGALSADPASLLGGEATDHFASYNEVGSLQIRASVNDYLGATDADILGVSPVIGRFYPAELVLAAGSAVTGSCNDMTYMDQPALAVDFALEARNTAGIRTQHYDQTLFGGTGNLATVGVHAVNSGDGVDRGSRLSGLPGSWVAGQYDVSVVNAAFVRAAAPDGPFDALQLSVSADDPLSDGWSLTGSSGSPASVAVGSTTSLRYGRLSAENAYGPETQSLPQPLNAEYFDSASGTFVVNGQDDCTEVNVLSMNGSPYVGTPVSLNGGAGDTTPTFTVSDSSGNGFVMTNGQAGLVYSAPEAGNTGTVLLEIDLGSFPWLQFDWDDDGSDDASMRPATATFGRYRGNDRVLFWQENFSR